MSERLCKYCGQPMPKDRKGYECASCAKKKPIVRQLIEVGEPLRVASAQRKARAMFK